MEHYFMLADNLVSTLDRVKYNIEFGVVGHEQLRPKWHKTIIQFLVTDALSEVHRNDGAQWIAACRLREVLELIRGGAWHIGQLVC